MGSERRRSPRILIDPPMRARVMGLETEVSIAEVSFGGFRVHSPVAFEPNSEHEFLVSPGRGCEFVRLDATVIHCRVLSTGPVVLFETGFAFTESCGSLLGVEALISGALSSLEA